MVYHEVGYVASGVFYLVEHLAGSVFGLVGEGLSAIDRKVPGFRTSMESLMGVPFMGPEVEALEMAVQFSRVRFAVKLQKLLTARAVNSAPLHRIYFGLTAEQVSSLAKTGHVLHVEHLDSALEFWVHSGAGGAIGHTEYGAALFLKELDLLKSVRFPHEDLGLVPAGPRTAAPARLCGQIEGLISYLYSGDALVPGSHGGGIGSNAGHFLVPREWDD
jgi:hypothetical protein